MEFMGMLSCSPCLKTWVTMTSPLAVVTETDILSTTICLLPFSQYGITN
uniref:Uncharacterized protein n=1 Tax=Anguilla anguilla TaxID=7936 RepID=A0A0E9V3M2_ANGAN